MVKEILKLIFGILINKLLEKFYIWFRKEQKQKGQIKKQKEKIDKAVKHLKEAGDSLDKKKNALDDIINTY